MTKNLPEQLWAAIRSDPDADAPRLVYADWLAEQGEQARSRLVHLQLARAQLPTWDADRVRLEVQESALLETHGAAWRAALPTPAGVTWGDFHRGFPGRVGFADVAVLVDHIEACRGATHLESIVVPWPRFDGADPLPAIPECRELTVHGTLMREEDVGWLASSPILGSLRSLNLVGYDGTSEAFRRLLASPHLKGLTCLRIPNQALGDEAVRAVVESGLALEALDLSVPGFEEVGSNGNDLPYMEEAAQLLASWSGLSGLRRLSVASTGIDAGSLLASLGAEGLEDLDLLSPSYYDDGEWLRFLGDASPKFRPRRVRLGMMRPDEHMIDYLASVRCLSEVRELALDDLWGDRRLTPLLEAPWLAELQILRVPGIDDLTFIEGLASLALSKLHTLQLRSGWGWNEHGSWEDVCRALVTPGFAELLDLGLFCPVDRSMAESLTEGAGLDQLLRLSAVTDDPSVAEAVASSPLGQRVASLQIHGVDHPGHAARRVPEQLSSDRYTTRFTEV